jgi:hypothetical protein
MPARIATPPASIRTVSEALTDETRKAVAKVITQKL